MAETQNNQQNQAQIQRDEVLFDIKSVSADFARKIDELFFEWYDDRFKLKHRDESFKSDESLTKLTALVRQLRSMLAARAKDKSAEHLRNLFDDFLDGNSDAAVAILKNRKRDDHVSKLIWLINVTTSVAILSRDLAEANQPLTQGPLANRNLSAQNVEQAVVPIANSPQMKSPSEFLGKVLPETFAAVAKHKHLALSAQRRAAFTGNEYHNVATMDSLYHDLGEALIFVTTDFFNEADRALTDNGKRLAASKVQHFDFNKLTAKEQSEVMKTMSAAFRKYANYTAELNMFSNVNDKLIVDAALHAYYDYLDDHVREQCKFTEQELRSVPNALQFAKQYRSEFNAAYERYSNQFVNGIYDAVKKEQDTVTKDWFENKITGDRVFRRGRLAGHGLKFMNTAPMAWLNKKMSEKPWLSLWSIPKLGMSTLNLLTNPAVHRIRKKFTGMLFATLRSFATGVKESFDKTGRSSEITVEDVLKKLKESIDKVKSIDKEKTTVTTESLLTIIDNELNEAFAYSAEQLKKLVEYVNTTYKSLFDKAVSDEALQDDIKKYEEAYNYLHELIQRDTIQNILKANIDNDSSAKAQLYNDVKEAVDTIETCHSEYQEVADRRANLDDGNAKDKDSSVSNTSIEVGEKTVQICEDVFDTLNKFLARQWNLLALHSRHQAMPLCAEYTAIYLDKLIPQASMQQPNAKESSIIDWYAYHALNEYDTHNEQDIRIARDRMNQNGKTTAKYPMKIDGKYRYHGIKLAASSEDSSRNGFGVFAHRLIQIADKVNEFNSYVANMGNASTQKTFDNSAKDEYISAAESTYVSSDDLLIEDIVNKIITKADKAADKAAKPIKQGINWLGKGVGTGLGKVVHGITHTGTADKDELIAKTIENNMLLTYTYSKSLKLSYLQEGANIVAAHCLDANSRNEFKHIATLTTAISNMHIPSCDSISKIAEALTAFKHSIGNIEFKPCTTVIDYELAEKINSGKLTDSADPQFGQIKGLFVGNYEGAREYAREITGEDLDAVIPYMEYVNAGREYANDTSDDDDSDDYQGDNTETKQSSNDNETEETYMNRQLDAQQKSHTQIVNNSSETDEEQPEVKLDTTKHKNYDSSKYANTYTDDEWSKVSPKRKQALIHNKLALKPDGSVRTTKEALQFASMKDKLNEINKIDWMEVFGE